MSCNKASKFDENTNKRRRRKILQNIFSFQFFKFYFWPCSHFYLVFSSGFSLCWHRGSFRNHKNIPQILCPFNGCSSFPGPRALYRGIGPCLLRAGPACAALFVAFEWTKKALSWSIRWSRFQFVGSNYSNLNNIVELAHSAFKPMCYCERIRRCSCVNV